MGLEPRWDLSDSNTPGGHEVGLLTVALVDFTRSPRHARSVVAIDPSLHFIPAFAAAVAIESTV
jgi:hypothetical protein